MSRIAVVQGASRGLGLGLAEALLEDGWQVEATCRHPERSAGLELLAGRHPGALQIERLDVRDESSIEKAAAEVGGRSKRIHLLMNCAGVLHEGNGVRPEKRLGRVEADGLRRAFEVNAMGPLLVAKHFEALLRHDERAVLANLSARVGSLGDNRLGGWYGYRASKAAQNMFTRNLALELRRTAPRLVCVALHPGTVDTELSRPFQRNVPPERLFAPERAARQLLDVVAGLGPEDSGGFFDWKGEPIPW